MKLTKSKQFLADAIRASGKGWMDGADWAAQDKTDGQCNDNMICFFSGPDKPACTGATKLWRCSAPESTFMGYRHSIKCDKLSPNWHQTVLSREEYFSAYPAEPVADADGWIEWKGGECPVGIDEVVDVMQLDGRTYTSMAVNFHWRLKNGSVSVARYRLHKPEVKSTAVGDDETNLAAKEELEELERSESPEQRDKLACIYRPSIEQLMQTYADRAHSLQLANEHLEICAKQVGEAMKALSSACKDAGFEISPITAKQEPERVITDWRDLRVGDIIEYVDGDIKDKIGMTGPVVELAPNANDGMYVRLKCDNGPRKGRLGWPKKWHFIRRP